MAPHDDLRAFQVSYDLGLAIIRSTSHWPKHELFGLSAQARRASSSISINIAEGVAKRGRRELRRYLDIALGSLAELDVLIRFAKDLEFIPTEEADQLEEKRAHAGRITWRLYESTVKGIGRPNSSD